MRYREAIFAIGLAVSVAPLYANTCVEVKPLRVSQVCGQVYDPAGEAVPNIHLQLQSEHKVVGEVTADANGKFDFSALPKGLYDLTTDSRGWYLHAPIEITSSKVQKSCKHPVSVKLGIQVCPGGSVSKRSWRHKG